LFVPASILGNAALGRTLAFALHVAGCATRFVPVEEVCGGDPALAATTLDASE
jgi:hypothetical protein